MKKVLNPSTIDKLLSDGIRVHWTPGKYGNLITYASFQNNTEYVWQFDNIYTLNLIKIWAHPPYDSLGQTGTAFGDDYYVLPSLLKVKLYVSADGINWQ
ncbi:MAG TPA: hypothetical protein PLN68_08805, partial [Elusimicrobiales bacterium]|nr:hypothetical protein [Elusimicrobiales bacterium]